MLSWRQLNSIGHGRLCYCRLHFSMRCIRSLVWYVSFSSTIGTVLRVRRVSKFSLDSKHNFWRERKKSRKSHKRRGQTFRDLRIPIAVHFYVKSTRSVQKLVANLIVGSTQFSRHCLHLNCRLELFYGIF